MQDMAHGPTLKALYSHEFEHPDVVKASRTRDYMWLTSVQMLHCCYPICKARLPLTITCTIHTNKLHAQQVWQSV